MEREPSGGNATMRLRVSHYAKGMSLGVPYDNSFVNADMADDMFLNMIVVIAGDLGRSFPAASVRAVYKKIGDDTVAAEIHVDDELAYEVSLTRVEVREC